MKLFSIRHRLWLGLLCAGAPALVVGCGGGNAPSLPAIPVSLPQFALQNGQLATLKFDIRGTSLRGTITIADGDQVDPLRRVPPGAYPFTGTFTPPRGYQGTSTLGTAGTLAISGDFPTTSQTGTYRVTFQGQTTNGVLPVLRNPVG